MAPLIEFPSSPVFAAPRIAIADSLDAGVIISAVVPVDFHRALGTQIAKDREEERLNL